MATPGQTEKPPKRTPRFDFSSLSDPTSVQTARKWAAEVGQRAIVELSLAVVIEDPDNPRTWFDEEVLQALAKGIKARGVMQPILVRERGPDGMHIIIHGARRYRASKIAGKTTIPAIIIPDAELHIYDDYSQVIENVQRENLNAEDIYAFIIKRLAKGDKKGDIAEKLGIPPRTVSAYLSFKDLPENILDLFRAGKIAGIEPLYDLVRLRAKAPELADQLVADAEQTNLGEITLAMIRRALKGAEQPQATGPQSGASQLQLVHSSSPAASSGGLQVGEALSSEAATAGGEEEPSGEAVSTVASPLTLEQTQDVQHIRSSKGDQNAEEPTKPQPTAGLVPFHNPDAHKASGSGDGRKPDPDYIRKPLLLGEIDGEPVKVLLTRRPTSPGLVHISREDTGIEEEVALDRIKLTLLSDMKVQETA
ncbi:ParB/RepB/Spo0J family partition protein [Propionivibrio sp.]|uniref:ParB/RepB/Spo0J family partition protein n=1 Tax=Propionivibrio sp. TaxID=2212460 RepID=UPI0039E2FD5C